jgi:hypothetical protein
LRGCVRDFADTDEYVKKSYQTAIADLPESEANAATAARPQRQEIRGFCERAAKEATKGAAGSERTEER